MKTIKPLGLALSLSVLLVGIWIAPSSNAGFGDGDCYICTWIEIPVPGEPPIIDHVCLSLGDEVGYSQCYECTNCTNCIQVAECYWSWP